MKEHNSLYPLSPFQPAVGNFYSWFLAFLCFTLTKYFNGNVAWIDDQRVIVLGVFIGCFWTIRLHAYREAKRIELHHQTINHFHRIVQRTMLAILISFAIHAAAQGISPSTFIRSGACTIFILAEIWLIFDFYLNNDRGKAILYVSSWYKSAWLDRLFNKINSR
jgi:hypothetical protein